jgi:hypothetical protein
MAKGAKGNHVNGLGMMPLHYAATVDYADAPVAELPSAMD